jgi:hypothetical protein
MMILIDSLKPIQSQVRVNLRRRNIGVPEDSLHGPQIRTVLHHVSGATVTQHVRARIASNIY